MNRSATGRDAWQALVAVFAVFALILAAALVPALTLPFGALPEDPDDGTNPPANRTADGASPVSALSPDERTGVGGPVGFGSGGDGANATHFVVETDRPAYWRTGAYGRYTGDGWRRIEDPSVYTGRRPSDGGTSVVQRVRLERPATALPSAYEPVSLRVAGDEDPTVLVTRRRALAVEEGVPAGTEYTVQSDVATPRPEQLRKTGRDYPESVERYTGLPSATPDRVRELTDRVTADADGPYETAVAVERWLESNKEYSLGASHDHSRPVADQFLFEMDAGYCEYFATSMVVMLRSQGIPARYVVGYTPGTRVGGDTYRVRSADAHAWVEVYFEGVGWVRFDPTPAADRTVAERRQLARDGATADRRATVAGSPGEHRGAPPGSVDGGNGVVDEAGRDAFEPRAPPYEIALGESPVPGKRVTVRVTKEGLPVTGVVVTFDGDVVGRTDINGEVTATVPYTDELTVDARRPGETDPALGPGSAGRASAGLRGTAATAATPTVPAGHGAAVAGATGPALSAVQSGDEETYDVPTTVTFQVDGTPAPGRSFVLRPTIEGVPVDDAVVTLNGERVGTTEDGQIAVDVPADAPDPVTLTVERGEVSDSTEIDLEDLQVHLDAWTVLALPGREATARVTLGGEPVEGASVTVDGADVGETDENGEVAVSVPFDDDVALGASGPYQSTTHVVDGLFLRLAALAGVPLGLVGVLVVAPLVALRLRGRPAAEPPLADFLAMVVAVLWTSSVLCWRGLARVWWFAVGGGVWLSRAAVSTAVLVGTTVLSVARWSLAPEGLASLLSGAAIRLGSWVASRSPAEMVSDVLALARTVPTLLAAVPGTARLVVLGVLPFTGVALSEVLGTDASGATTAATTRDEMQDATPSTTLSVREAWRQFLRLLPFGRYRTMTPGEIGRAAVDRGFPAGPVETLVEAFRAVEYGGQAEARGLRNRVTDAVQSLRSDDGQQLGGEDR